MADQLSNLIPGTLLSGTGVTTVRTAVNTGTPNNERLTIKRLQVVNVLAAGGQTVAVSLWRGSASTDAYAIKKTVNLAPGESLEFDPTTMILAPGDSLFVQASVANAISVQGDGLKQTE